MDLTTLGLSTYEAQAYRTLVRSGKQTAAEVSKKSKVPYGRIYDVLASLEQKGLVKVVPGITKRFYPTSPQALAKLVTQKEQELATLKEQVTKMEQTYENLEEEPVTIATGKANFYKIIRELPDPQKYRYAIKVAAEYRPAWGRIVKGWVKKGVDFRNLVDPNEEAKKNIVQWKKIYDDFRVMKNKSVALSIIDDKVVMIGLIKSNTTMLVRDAHFAQVMKSLFEAKYQKSKKL